MFSLIITIISIALVAALALATLYYGGSSFNKGDAQSRATQVVVQGQQLLAAADLFYADNQRWPASMDELVEKSYLKQVPSVTAAAGPALTATAHAAATTWTMPSPGRPTFMLATSVREDTCKLVNLKVRGDNGILAKAYTSLGSQCYGGSTDALKVVVTKDSAGLSPVLPASEVVTGAIPSPATVTAWLAAPVSTSGVANTPTPPSISAESGGDFGTLPDANTVRTLAFTIKNTSTAPLELTYASIDGQAFGAAGTTCAPVEGDPVVETPASIWFSGGPWQVGAGQTCSFTVSTKGSNLTGSVSSALRVGVKNGTTLTWDITATAPAASYIVYRYSQPWPGPTPEQAAETMWRTLFPNSNFQYASCGDISKPNGVCWVYADGGNADYAWVKSN